MFANFIILQQRSGASNEDKKIFFSSRYIVDLFNFAVFAIHQRLFYMSLSAKMKVPDKVKTGSEMHASHLERYQDEVFVAEVRKYRTHSEPVFRNAEALRVTLAKHEVPKTDGLFAEAPGYGRMNLHNGGMYWFIILKDGSVTKIDRREIGNDFLCIDGNEI